VATAIAMADNAMKNSPQTVLPTEKRHYPQMADSILMDSLQYVTFAQNGLFTEQMWQDALTEFKTTTATSASGIDVSENGSTWTDRYIKTSALSGSSAS
jgi:hypothetical protein